MDENAREQLKSAANWLGWHNENLSFGLKSPDDGLKLWREWQADPTLPEFCDYDPSETTAQSKARIGRVRRILGYDPWKRARQMA